MSMKKDAGYDFDKVVRNIDGHVDPFQEIKIPFYPVTEGKILYMDVESAGGWFLGIAHHSTAIIILIGDCSCILTNVKIPEDASDKETQSTYIHGGHEFSLGQ